MEQQQNEVCCVRATAQRNKVMMVLTPGVVSGESQEGEAGEEDQKGDGCFTSVLFPNMNTI